MNPYDLPNIIHGHLVDTLGLFFLQHASYSYRPAYRVKPGTCLSVWYTNKTVAQVFNADDKVAEVDLTHLEDPRPALTKLVIHTMFQ